MAIKKTKPKPRNHKAEVAKTNGKPRSYKDSIRRRLSVVPGVDAVYTWIDPHRVIHVVSVVKEHKEHIYDVLIPQEGLVEKDFPKLAFDFHVSARQRRTVDEFVPTSGELIFKK